MSAEALNRALQGGIATGILPANAGLPVQENRPWPVVLLTAFGAWLAVIPLFIVIALIGGEDVLRGPASYVVGALLLVAAIAILRRDTIALFVEQIAVPMLIVGAITFAIGFFRDLPTGFAAAILVVVGILIAWAIPRPWMRVLLGSAAACLAIIACRAIVLNVSWFAPALWLALHAVLACWLLANWFQRTTLITGAHANLAAAWESLSVGWILPVLAGLAISSGMTMLVGANSSGAFLNELTGLNSDSQHPLSILAPLTNLMSSLLACVAAGWLAQRWVTLRQIWCIGAAAVVVVLAWFMPALGAVMLVLALCVTDARWRVATTAAVAAAWIVGAFYYQLSLPLASKALLLASSGMLLGVFGWLAVRRRIDPEIIEAPIQSPTALRAGHIAIAVSAVAVLLVVNIGIAQKENLISHGKTVYLSMAPRDPRSLMQGDYMALNFPIPAELQAQLPSNTVRNSVNAVGILDGRGVATLTRIDDGRALSTGEFRFELLYRAGEWTLVSNAWFFKEGEEQRWAAARFGEFRVTPEGHAALVGLRGAALQPL